jgi:hypothetical protein
VRKFLIEGLDRLGKDTLIQGIQHRRGYHQVLHYSKPLKLDCYLSDDGLSAERCYQEASFRTLFHFLRDVHANIICNRAHLGECVYAPLYRGYSGDYVFDIESEFNAGALASTRLILLTEDFDVSRHYVDDGLSLGAADQRRKEQGLFCAAFNRSAIQDKRVVCVTDRATGDFRSKSAIVDEAVA